MIHQNVIDPVDRPRPQTFPLTSQLTSLLVLLQKVPNFCKTQNYRTDLGSSHEFRRVKTKRVLVHSHE